MKETWEKKLCNSRHFENLSYFLAGIFDFFKKMCSQHQTTEQAQIHLELSGLNTKKGIDQNLSEKKIIVTLAYVI